MSSNSHTEEEVLGMVREAQIGVTPIIGREYFLYRRSDDSLFVSIVEPEYWGERFQLEFVAAIWYVSDQTWSKIE